MFRAIAVQGMAFGDEGKGATTDFLVRALRSPLVVRFNGGPQAAHNVVTPEGVHHTFAQFGSGTLAGARTHLSRFMLVEPLALGQEAAVLAGKGVADPLSLLTVDPDALVITPYHVLANRARERLRGDARHGSVGLGVGETRGDYLEYGRYLTYGHLSDPDETLERLRTIQLLKSRQIDAYRKKTGRDGEGGIEEYNRLVRLRPEEVVRLYAKAGVDKLRHASLEGAWFLAKGKLPDCAPEAVCVMEGAQGVLLDETYGVTPPYVSWTDCTFRNAERLVEEEGGEMIRLGVFRSYFTRHGPGPFPSEDPGTAHPEPHNGAHPWMGPFRQGRFDLKLARYAVDVARPDALALTHEDRFGGRVLSAEGSPLTLGPYDLRPFLRLELGVPVALTADGPTAADRQWLSQLPPWLPSG